ncbi:MAG: ABC transporter ATP-binding protein [Thaumarchaeota archaeon]|nr:ABC transporter ATP-binding protein [Nitrososphaerota archaeon]
MGSLLEIRDLSVSYFLGKTVLHAVDGLSLDIREGEILAVVGESGSGKSTTAHAVMRATRPPGRVTNGSILFHGTDLLKMTNHEFQKIRWEKISILSQASQNSFSPTMRIRAHFRETMSVHGFTDNKAIDEVTRQYLKEVSLEPDRVLNAYPHELSGGMKQRTAIALTLVLNPELIILDEPTSALDVVTQKMTLELVKKVHEKTNVTILFITHDMPLVSDFADRTVVMYAGKVAEIGSTTELFNNSRHPYSYALIKAVPTIYGKASDVRSIPGSPPDLINRISGCGFRSRCAHAQKICEEQEPPLIEVQPGHLSACHFARTIELTN